MHREISSDLNRTFTKEFLKTEECKTNLYKVLFSVALLKPQIGYCQGMNFISAAILIFFQNDIEMSIEFFFKLIENYDMTYLFVKVNLPCNRHLRTCQIIL